MGRAPSRCRRCHLPGHPFFCLDHAPCNVTVVAGPPGAGKTTYVARHATPGDLIWDWDAVMSALTSTSTHTQHEHLHPYVAEARNAIIATLRRQLPQSPKAAWIISSDATTTERARWHPWPVVTIDTPASVCIDRLTRAGRTPSAITAVRDWWNRYEPAA